MRRFTTTTIVIVFCALVTACNRQSESTEPKFSGRLLVLAQDWDLHSDLIEITPGLNSTYNQTVITSDVFYATASPDQTQLLYSTRDGIFLRDLRSGVVRQLAPRRRHQEVSRVVARQ